MVQYCSNTNLVAPICFKLSDIVFYLALVFNPFYLKTISLKRKDQFLFPWGIAYGQRFHCKNIFFMVGFVMLGARKYYFPFDFVIVFM